MNDISYLFDDDSALFEERADYIDEDALVDWTSRGKLYNEVQSKLIGTGAKLLVGPRGTGKTHHMRCAYHECKQDKKKPFPVYVTFNRYLRLEKLLSSSSNAIEVFHAWVLAKISFAASENSGLFFTEVEFDLSDLKRFIEDVERQYIRQEHSLIISFLSVEVVKEFLVHAMKKDGRGRVLLLLDDAALTLTHDYMIEFFDIFRSLKSALISPKASVYPGTTQYGPRFHIGHDAEVVNAWLDTESREYLEFMKGLINARLEGKFNIPEEMLQLLMYASFGVPRAFLMMLRDYIVNTGKGQQAKFNSVVQQKRNAILAEYRSIGHKIPQYKKIISVGEAFFLKLVEELKELNRTKIEEMGSNYKKVVAVGMNDIPPKAKRMIQFLVEAGMLHRLSDISHGTGRKLERYIPHYTFLLEARVFTINRGFKAQEIVDVLTSPSEKHPMRRTFGSLLSEDEISQIELDLPVCPVCDTVRITEQQKFCHSCGTALVDVSAFDSCMKTKLSELPLTKFQLNAIRNYTEFETVQDVLSIQDPATELRKARGIGPKYSERIFRKINSWVDEYLV